jgi:hypothetical protein
MSRTYTVDELFEDIPDDNDNCIFKIPPEICEEMGLDSGDTVSITAEEGKLIIRKV